ncbi:MAG: BrnT family toxin [Oscillatoriophycideae cyanobacterium NC_groundwater_1537_Pr4_S-0.65um_50_18]|nr:BrnT family toxin [Oscillatoriophycideae cyanobacterium NC_groundwater_1537_Pr4_S-0.65um_50_18]
MQFEWDEEKGDRNFKKHGVRFEEATTVFLDANAITLADVIHSEIEERTRCTTILKPPFEGGLGDRFSRLTWADPPKSPFKRGTLIGKLYIA